MADPVSGIHRAPHERPIGVVFQDYLLFPHLTVLDNVAFGPLVRGMEKSEARRRAAAWLARVGIADLAEPSPGSCLEVRPSGWRWPARSRPSPSYSCWMSRWPRLTPKHTCWYAPRCADTWADFPGATLLVTHDPIDAAVLADRLVVIEHGRVVQQGLPQEVARRPRTDYVARLVGLNLLAGRGHGHRVLLPTGGSVELAESAFGDVHVAFRPPLSRSSYTVLTDRPATSGRVASLHSSPAARAYAWRSLRLPTLSRASWLRSRRQQSLTWSWCPVAKCGQQSRPPISRSTSSISDLS